MRPNFPRSTMARLPLEHSTAIRLSEKIAVPVMAFFSLTLTEPVAINWPTCWFPDFATPMFGFCGFFAARVEPVLNAPKTQSVNDSSVTSALRALANILFTVIVSSILNRRLKHNVCLRIVSFQTRVQKLYEEFRAKRESTNTYSINVNHEGNLASRRR